jgi:hypothetical protein
MKVKVTWPNAGTALLPEAGASVSVTADGTQLTPVESATGQRTFLVPDGTSQLQIQATFSATLGPVPSVSAPRMTAVVLDATQMYAVANGQLSARTIADYGGPHPLVAIRSATARLVTVVVRTEFVDLSAFWAKFALYWDYYLAEHTAGTTTYVLGFTGGAPLLWLAIVPDAMATFTRPFTSCLVFYRPNNYAYSRIDQKHDSSAIGRYFLTPKPDSNAAAKYWECDHIDYDPARADPLFNQMRCQFEQALFESQRALVMLHPWPSGSWFGVAQQAGLSGACQLALRFLWSKGAICKNVAGVQLGRLGLSGFSRGGDALWSALVANASKVREVYAFDCTSTDSNVDAICRWFQSSDSNFLRLTNGTLNFALYAKIQNRLDPKHVGSKITVVPESAAEYAPGNNSVWEHFISTAPDMRGDDDTRHQWSVCGGEMMGGKTAPYEVDAVMTYFHMALNASGFQKLSG